ncbi:alpha/beta hydrolase [bacterium]|nr:alpha/beta hydrolase [bacterium]
MKKILLSVLLLLVFTGCVQKVPITWEERVIKKMESNVSLAYSEYGKRRGKTLLFLHGFGENRHTWRFLVADLSKHYHVILLDLKGFGDSPKREDEFYSVYDQAHEVNRFMEEHKLENVTLVGRSFGGGVALVLALIQEEKLIKKKIDKLVLINSMAYRQKLPSMMERLNQPLIGYLGIHLLNNRWIAYEAYKFAFHDDSLIPPKSIDYAAKYLAFPLAKYAYLKTVNQLIPDDLETMEKRYKEITLPTLILWGKEDVSIPIRTAHRLHRDLKESRLKVFPHVAHMAQEEIPNKISQEILKFMEENE